jgi:hypothetical protein
MAEDGFTALIRTARTTLACMLICNLLAAIAFPVAVGFVVGGVKMSVMDFYSVLDAHGVINHSELASFRSGQFAGKWDVPDYLTQELDVVVLACFSASVAFVMNAVLLSVCWWRLRGRPTSSADDCQKL